MRVWKWSAVLALAAMRSAHASFVAPASGHRAASPLERLPATRATTPVNVTGTNDCEVDYVATSPPRAAELSQWTTTVHHAIHTDRAHCTDCFLVVGVKSSVVSGYHRRQTIRETWGDATAARANGVRIVFLGCEPSFESDATAQVRYTALDAITEEKKQFEDLLTHELGGCIDSYFTLVDKTIGFFKWMATKYPNAQFAMVADDDTYVRIDKLVAMLRAPSTSHRRFYAGQVWGTQFNTTIRPIRSSAEKNYVSHDRFPMATFPRFAIGPQYMLSGDLVRFLARNSDELRGVGTLEDVSVAFWLLSLLQLQPIHLDQFDNIRFQLCHNALISYTDLSSSGMRAAHANVVNSRSFCYGFSFTAWAKPSEAPQLLPLQLVGQGRAQQPIKIQWDLRYEWSTHIAHIVVTLVASQTNESASVVYFPSLFVFIDFCRELYDAAKVSMPTTALNSDFTYQLRDRMIAFVQESMIEEPQLKTFFTLALVNAQRGIRDLAIFVRLSVEATPFRTLIENLMAEIYKDTHVYVLDAPAYHARFQYIPVDFEVVVGGDETINSVCETTGTIRIVLEMGERLETFRAINHECSVYIVDRPNSHLNPQRTLLIPEASLGFLNTTKHTPLDLLKPRPQEAGDDIRQILIVDCTGLGVVASTGAQVFLSMLQEQGMAIASSICERQSNQESSLSLDDMVTEYSQFHFALIIEERLNLEDHISSKIITAFLAGCIPIYIGHHPTVSRVFNRKAFVNCHEFDSLRKCAERVMEIYRTPALYEEMRKQPPVSGNDPFYDAFSWHPAIISQNRLPIAHRLKSMLETIEPRLQV